MPDVQLLLEVLLDELVLELEFELDEDELLDELLLVPALELEEELPLDESSSPPQPAKPTLATMATMHNQLDLTEAIIASPSSCLKVDTIQRLDA